MVIVQYSSQSKPLLTIDDAIKANSTYPYPGEANVVVVGDANGMFMKCASNFHLTLCTSIDNRYKHVYLYNKYNSPNIICQIHSYHKNALTDTLKCVQSISFK